MDKHEKIQQNPKAAMQDRTKIYKMIFDLCCLQPTLKHVDSNYTGSTFWVAFGVVLSSSFTGQSDKCASLFKPSSGDRELKFPFTANRIWTLPITLLNPGVSTQGKTLEEIASNVIYLTVLFLSFSFRPLALLPYLFMILAVIGNHLSGHVSKILISHLPPFLPFPSSSPPRSQGCV